MPSRYEDELWRELVDKHGEEPAGEHPPAPPWRPRGPWAAAGGAALVAAAATGGVLAYSAISAPAPAYAVTRNHDGSVRIYLGRTSAIKDLNARLKAMNVHAQAVLLSGGCPAPAALATASLHAHGKVNWTIRGQAVLRPAKAAARMHILLVRRASHGKVSLSNVVSRTAPGTQVPACVNHVQVFTSVAGAAPRAVVVRPMTLSPAPGFCGPPRSPVGTSTGATTTTGDTTMSGTATNSQSATTPTTETTGATATTGATSTTGQPSGPTTVFVRCCRMFVADHNSGQTTTSGDTTTSGATTPTTDTTQTTGTTAVPPTRTVTWTTTNGTVTTTTVPHFRQVPAGAAGCAVHAGTVAVHIGTTTAPAPPAQTGTTGQTSTTAQTSTTQKKSKKH